MELILALAIGVLTGSGIWLLLRPRTFQVIMGLTLLSYAVNLFIFSMGSIFIDKPPIVAAGLPADLEHYTDPMPQSLVLTAIVIGFATTIAGIAVLLALAGRSVNPWGFAPGLLLIGVGLGTMLTPSVDIVQSAFSDSLQGEISGLSRSISNLGSCLGTAIAGTILVAGLTTHAYAAAMIALAVAAAAGLIAAMFLPRSRSTTRAGSRSG